MLMNEWYLTHIDASQNKNKFYSVSVSKLDSGEFHLTAQSGRIGTKGVTQKSEDYVTHTAAVIDAEKLVHKKRNSKRDPYSLERKVDNSEQLVPAKKVEKISESEIEIAPLNHNVKPDFWSGLMVC